MAGPFNNKMAKLNNSNIRQTKARSLYKIVGICGSLRAKSTNLTALKIAGEALIAKNVDFEILSYTDLPIYNGDIEAVGIPDSVKALH
jgi:NAD(P)H-dependent FMN reductase